MEATTASLRNVSPVTRPEWALVCALFAAALLPIVVSATDYGPTYDEPHYASAGVRYADWWARVFRFDLSAFRSTEIEAAWGLNHEHPPLQKCASGFSQRWLGAALPGLAAMRLPSAIWFALTVCALYLFTRGVWGRRGALFAALALVTMPRVVAHAHLTALDMPIAAWFFIAAALTSHALSRDSWQWSLLAGLAFGFALMSKLNAFFLPVLLIPWGLIYHRSRWPKLAFVLAVGSAAFWLGWPWLWLDPVAHFREYADFHFRHAAYNVWYLSRIHQYAPWHYPFVMTAVTTPALLLALAVPGIVRSWPRRREDPNRALLLFALAVTLLPNALPTSPKYNGVRLFLPAFPFVAALAGGGFAWLQERVVGRGRLAMPEARRLSVLIGLALGAALLWPGMAQVRLTHPYQLAYYNSLVGGTGGATARGFETIYWGQVLQEAPDFLNRVAEPGPRVLVIPRGVIYLLEFQQQVGALRDDIEWTGDGREAASADYVVFQAMQSDYTDLCWALVDGTEPVHTVGLGTTPLLLVYDRNAIAAALERLRT
jgi:4-amino-4-deoxy-L-arabinose transferase-like glycosyltransferase